MQHCKVIVFSLISALFFTSVWADDSELADVDLGYHLRGQSTVAYTVLNDLQYQRTVENAREFLDKILKSSSHSTHQSISQRLDAIIQPLMDIPYLFSGAQGEGDWQPSSNIYRPGAVHVKQDPPYRLDGLNCQTFVQIVMALLYSTNLEEFDRHFLKIAYGAATISSSDVVHYYNRNHFVDGDWNPVNQRNGWLTDVTAADGLDTTAKSTTVTLTRQNWFLQQGMDLQGTVRVLHEADGPVMAKRFSTVYASLKYPNFDSEKVTISYIPKESIVIEQSDGSLHPNQQLLDKLQTPAVLEIVRDARKWNVNGKNIKEAIGSELSISHLGFIYRKEFNKGDLIYQKISCKTNQQKIKICEVKPILCQKAHCNELMFVHATSAFPNGYYWYKRSNGRYTCSASAPSAGVPYSQCNRVQESPLFDYLGAYVHTPSILGVHVERLSD